jgi:hypothetical protein
VEGIRSDFALLLLRFELLDERGKTTGERRRDDVVLGLERLFPMAQSQAALLGLRTARFLEGETWRDRITDLDRMVPILGLS